MPGWVARETVRNGVNANLANDSGGNKNKDVCLNSKDRYVLRSQFPVEKPTDCQFLERRLIRLGRAAE